MCKPNMIILRCIEMYCISPIGYYHGVLRSIEMCKPNMILFRCIEMLIEKEGCNCTWNGWGGQDSIEPYSFQLTLPFKRKMMVLRSFYMSFYYQNLKNKYSIFDFLLFFSPRCRETVPRDIEHRSSNIPRHLECTEIQTLVQFVLKKYSLKHQNRIGHKS